MRWKLKAVLQNAISMLPSGISYETYYKVQRRFGALRRYNPMRRLSAGVETLNRLRSWGFEYQDATFVEIGTGRVPLVPMAFWLAGAGKIISLDTNPYLKHELIVESVRYMQAHRDEVIESFGELLRVDRLDQLLSCRIESIREFLECCQIEYRAPADARWTELADDSVDFLTSYAVLEHIPRDVVIGILREGQRIVRPTGASVHWIDYTDHFSHSDSSISSVNFLKFTDSQWNLIAGNRYMYMNRLRHDDFLDVFANAGLQILDAVPNSDQEVREKLEANEIRVAEKFRDKDAATLSVIDAWVAAR